MILLITQCLVHERAIEPGAQIECKRDNTLSRFIYCPRFTMRKILNPSSYLGDGLICCEGIVSPLFGLCFDFCMGYISKFRLNHALAWVLSDVLDRPPLEF